MSAARIRDCVAGLDVDPDDWATVLGMAAVGVTTLAWRNGPVEDWHKAQPSRIIDPELMRANAATTRAVRGVLLDRFGQGVPAAALALDGLHEIGRLLGDPDRRLPGGRSVADLAPGPEQLAAFRSHVWAGTYLWSALAIELGPTTTLGMLACVVGRRSRKWWLTPWWPDRVAAFGRRLEEPRLWGDPNVIRHVRRLHPPADATDHDELVHQLLVGPDQLSARAAAYCLSAGLGECSLTAWPDVDRRALRDIVSLLDPQASRKVRAQAANAVLGSSADPIAVFPPLIETQGGDVSIDSSPEPEPFLLTVEEAALRLRVGRTMMFELIRTGQVKSVKVGSLRRIRPADLQAYADRLGAEGDRSLDQAA